MTESFVGRGRVGASYGSRMGSRMGSHMVMVTLGGKGKRVKVRVMAMWVQYDGLHHGLFVASTYRTSWNCTANT